MKSYGSTTRGGSWSGAHVPLPTAPVVHQRPHITELAHAADRAPTVVLSDRPNKVESPIQTAVRLHHAGTDYREIARLLDLRSSTALAWLKAEGLDPLYIPDTRAEKRAARRARALTLHASGQNPAEIARAVGVTPRAVRMWIAAEGLSPNRGVAGGKKGQGAIPAEQAQQIVDLYQPGVSVNSIAKEVGLSRITVLKYLHLAGIEVTRAKHTARRPPQPTDDTPKTCTHCGNTFTRRDGEKPGGWRARTTCDRTCAAHLVAKARKAKREAA